MKYIKIDASQEIYCFFFFFATLGMNAATATSNART